MSPPQVLTRTSSRELVHEATSAGHLTLRQLRARAEEIDLMGALRVERAIQRLDAP